ncbi:DUF6266 family protein [Prolixibacteraceae bacterium]|nr:DUF6266 family protein [Prolixibacteraceae bacterium]
MAIIKNNQMSGLIGPVVQYQVKGQTFMRTRPDRRKKLSPKQLSQVNKMKMTMKFLKGVRDLVSHSYPADNPFSNGHVLARSAILRNAFQGIYPNLVFDLSKVELSSETISGIQSITAVYRDGVLELSVQKDPNASVKNACFVLIHEPGQKNIQTYIHGPFTPSADTSCTTKLSRSKDHGPVQHFWVMLLDTVHTHYYKSCYFSLSDDDCDPQTFHYNA